MITKDLTENMGLVMPPKTSEYSENIMVTRIPFIGRVHFVKDTNGILSLGFVVLYWIYGTWCSLYVILLPHVRDGQASELFVFVFCVCSIMCLSSLFRVSTLNPGRIPLISDESSFGLDVTKWEVCPKCCRKRPPRAHHCRRCQQCVLRMDHHCPWINNCVGEENHWAFMQLLFWAFWLGFFAFVACQLHFWYYPACITCDKEAFVVRYSSWLTYLLTVLGFFMMLCMTGSLIGQHFSLLVDRTTLENMRDPRPDISKLNIRTELTAYKEVCGEGRVIFWLFPCRRRRARPFYLLTVNTV